MRQTLLAAALPLSLLACTDPAAVRSFAAEAPPPAAFPDLIASYDATVSGVQLVAAVTQRSCPIDAAAQHTPAAGLLPMHASWTAYMDALGRLADDRLVTDTGPAVDQVAAGASAARDAGVFRASDQQIAAAADLARLLAEVVTRGMRQDALRRVIGEGQQPFQAALDIELLTIDRGYLRELGNYASGYDALQTPVRAALSASLDPTAGRPAPLPLARAAAQADCMSLLSASGQLPPRGEVARRQAAARLYADALRELKEAHDQLYRKRNDVLTKATFDEIQPVVMKARAAWSSLAKL